MLKSLYRKFCSKFGARKRRERERYFRIQRNIENVMLQQRVNMLNQDVLRSTQRGTTDYKYFDDHQIIVSLTTYGARLSQVYLSIESIMQQSKQANRIVLWLSKELEGTMLPQPLINQVSRGLEIYYCDDIRSYTKLIPALKRFPNDAIITIDDDVIYNIYTLESLINSYIENQDYIYFNRGHRVTSVEDGIMPYTSWESCINNDCASVFNFPTGIGGVLYPPHILGKEVFNEDVFMSDCKYADDVWFYAMALYNDKRSRLSKMLMISSNLGCLYMKNSITQASSLYSVNVEQGLNDIQLHAVFNRYGLYDKLKE